MPPLPSLSGSGGSAKNGDFSANSGISNAFGSFQVGGRGNNGAGGSASASPSGAGGSALPGWMLPVGIGAGVLLLLGFVLLRR